MHIYFNKYFMIHRFFQSWLSILSKTKTLKLSSTTLYIRNFVVLYTSYLLIINTDLLGIFLHYMVFLSTAVFQCGKLAMCVVGLTTSQ